MKRATWLFSTVVVVAGSIAADKPDQAGKTASSGLQTKAKDNDKAKEKAPAGSPPATVQERPKAAVSVDPRASSLFRSAQNLEKTGKTPGAISLYRDVLIRYPECPEAPASTERIKALGGKLPAPSEIHPAPPPEEAKFIRAPKPKYASQEANRAALNQMIGGAISQPAVSGPANKAPY